MTDLIDTDTTTPVPPKAKAKAAKAKADASKFDRLKAKKGMVRRMPVYLDSEAVDEHEEARLEVELLNNPAVAARTPSADQAAAVARLDAAKAALDEATVLLTLRSPRITTDDDPPRHLRGRQAYEWILGQHPVDPDENEKHKAENNGEELPYNADTFAPAIVAACIREDETSAPDMTAEEVEELFEEWNITEVMAVFTAAMEVCNASQIGMMGKGFGAIGGSRKN